MRRIKPQLTVASLMLLLTAMAMPPSSAIAANTKRQIGQASGSLGTATIDGKPLNIGSPVYEGSRIATGATDSASVLLDSKVVLKFAANTAATVTEAKGTRIQIEQGNVEVFVAKRLPGAGAVALSDPDATIEALGTVVIGSYTPATRGGWYCTLESTRPQGVTIRGKAEPGPTDLGAGQFVKFEAGKMLNPPAGLDPGEVKKHLGTIAELEKASGRRAGTFQRQRTALTELARVANLVGGVRLTSASATAANNTSTRLAMNDSRSAQSVNELVSAGIISSTGTMTLGPSTGGLSDVSVQRGSGNVLQFRLFDTGAPDGDQVSLTVFGSNGTLLKIPVVTVSSTGSTFSSKVPAGTINIAVTAINEGAIPPNTGGIQVLSTVLSGQATQSYVINTGQTATLRVKTK